MCTKLNFYNYQLPGELIAQQPSANREDSRLLVLCRNTGRIEHRKFHEITDYLLPGDLLVLNNTKVIPARIIGNRVSGALIELLLVREVGNNLWSVLINTNARLRADERIYFEKNTISAKLLDKTENGFRIVEFDSEINVKALLNKIGRMPLPPYIKRAKGNDTQLISDRIRYQTVFAQKEGAIAAPTAGLHFTNDILEKIRRKEVEIGFVTLHVGAGTFLPVKTEDIREHSMHKEYYECTEETFRKIKKTKELNKRVIAVGSTSCRVLETIAVSDTSPQLSGWTDLFIYPPYDFKCVDALITNFHLPKTTLLMLVSAFAGRENVMNAYEIAKSNGYRFFSYGDCMMII